MDPQDITGLGDLLRRMQDECIVDKVIRNPRSVTALMGEVTLTVSLDQHAARACFRSDLGAIDESDAMMVAWIVNRYNQLQYHQTGMQMGILGSHGELMVGRNACMTQLSGDGLRDIAGEVRNSVIEARGLVDSELARLLAGRLPAQDATWPGDDTPTEGPGALAATSRDEAFARLVTDTIGPHAASRLPSACDEFHLAVHGRPVHVQHLSDTGHVVVSTAVFATQDELDLHPDLLADFNARHLHLGGYCLLIDESTRGLYVAQRWPVDHMSAQDLRAHVKDLALRAYSCTTWYAHQVGRRQVDLLGQLTRHGVGEEALS